MLRGGTLFSGIGAPEQAMPWVDWRWCAEIDPQAAAVHHAHHDTLNLGDVNHVRWDDVESIDLLVFGSPCQSFSVAGKRLGMDDARGNLALVALGVVRRLRPRWFIFENVPGLLSSDRGGDFATFLRLVDECGYHAAWRVLDAQYAGVPQRRRRIFLVGHSGDWRSAAAVLFEPASLRGNPAPSREAGEGIARPLASCAEGGSGYRNDSDTAENLVPAMLRSDIQGVDRGHEGHGRDEEGIRPAVSEGVADTLISNGGSGGRYDKHPLTVALRGRDGGGTAELGDDKATALRASQGGGDKPHVLAYGGNNQSGPIDIATAVNAHGGPHGRLDFESETFVTHTLRAEGHDASEDGTGRGVPLAVAFSAKDSEVGASSDLAPTLRGMQHAGGHANGGGQIAVAVHENQRAEVTTNDTAGSLTVGGGKPGQGYPTEFIGPAVRRLTPMECERLQGFPDGYTAVSYNGKPMADGPRYRMLGNSMAVPIVRWIGDRLQRQEDGAAAVLARKAEA